MILKLKIILLSTKEKKLNKVPQINTQQVRNRKNFLKLKKGTYGKPTANIICDSVRLNVFGVETGAKQECLLSPFLFKPGTGGSGYNK